ncbi:MAG: hypothetical protein K0U19_04485 [Proteobacteria bacterium]|nr:hypothetical protein [Pseudomonadota bacterium]
MLFYLNPRAAYNRHCCVDYMIKWLFVLALVAAASWWWTRPSRKQETRQKTPKNIKMQQCEHCGVYIESGSACHCDKSKTNANPND